MSENQISPALEGALARAVEMMTVAARFLDENSGISEQTIFYDEAECDGGCVAEDLRHAVKEIKSAMER